MTSTQSLDLDDLLTPGGGMRVMQRLSPEDSGGLVGQVVGNYRIESLLGTGGMSTVYLAQRVDGEYDQSVAIKLLRHEHRDRRSEKRIRLERQILADLSHPNIAGLLDGGVAPDGRPYLVMEHINGIPIDQYCAEQGLDLTQRIKLFTQVVWALDHAHRAAVVHRDIKPSNVLVSREGTVKLLDFGIAKSVDNDAIETGRLLTLSYSSPEQIEGGDISIATDIYQLGIVLYLLLTGRHPYASESGSQVKVMQAVSASAPVRPSDALQSDGKRTESNRVRGDLDAIVLKCLQRRPQDRYTSAAQLAEDLKAFRKGRPVSARGAGPGYALSRLLMRNRLAAGVALVSAIALIAVVVVAFLQISSARNAAIERAQAAERIQALTRQMLDTASPYSGRDASSSAALLDSWEREVRVSLADEAPVMAELLFLIGSNRLQLGQLDAAWSSFSGALAAAREPPQRAAIQVGLADVAFRSGDPEAALGFLEQSRSALDGADLARWHGVNGRVLREVSRLAEALESFRLASKIYAGLGAGYGDEALRSRSRWAQALVFAEQPRQALAVMESALVDGEFPAALDGLARADVLTDYGEVLGINGRVGSALEVFQKALTIRRQYLDELHPDIAKTLGSIGRSLNHLGREPESVEAFEQALAIHRNGAGLNNHELATIRFNYANTLSDLARLEDAKRVFEQIRDSQAGASPTPTLLCKVYNNLGNTQLEMGNLDASVDSLERAVSCKLAVYGPDAMTTGNSQLSLADALLESGNTEGTAALIDSGLEIRTGQFGPDSPRLAFPMELRGELLSRQGDHPAALAHLTGVISLRSDNGETGSMHFAQTTHRLARAHARSGSRLAAFEAYDRAAEMVRSGRAPTHPVSLAIRVDCLEAYVEAGQPPPEPVLTLHRLVTEHAPYRQDLLDRLKAALEVADQPKSG